MLFQIDHRSSRLAALLSELFCPLSLPLVLALISLQQLQYDSFIHLLPFIVVIARNSISLAIGIDVIFFLLSEGGPVESKKRHCKWRALTLIINKALLRSWGLGHIIKERIPRKGVKLRAFSILSEPFVCAYWKIWATSSLSDLIQIISQSGLLDSEWVREVLGLSPNVGLEALAESLNIPEGSQDKDSLKVLTELPRSQSMKVLALLVGSLVIVVMKNEGALLHFHDMGKDHGMRKRKKRCKVRRYREWRRQSCGDSWSRQRAPLEQKAASCKHYSKSSRIQQDCRHEMPIKSVKGSLIKAGKQEDLTELMMDRISKGERLS
ncbi:hypothetical protein L1987_87154 [Smallanthus sonchifolius]|nr:hypothetical protein L1987_89825 [Smallanthus sonchifolius]KAI3664505.1 hypothetical protein L1987_89733 [Smallanthus sonchifolius]KAI3664573.1 hypothetical protein L1987_89663 [Smallanthus sonchifolius]KAI3666364.1 hypothetical protein L1987_89138 [Smallanthus sonchifolius]KAI3666527.1 hypothetical protein L1987_88951 [Smallanthus sonchifolius]